MNKKDWGATAFKVQHTSDAYTVNEVFPQKIGTKYITLNGKEHFFVETGRQADNFRSYSLLFPTREAANDYIQREQVIAYVKQFLNYDGNAKARRMNINQLQQLRGLFSAVK
jgi:hypothetical protein